MARRRRDKDDVADQAGKVMHETGDADLSPVVAEFDESAENLLNDAESAVVDEFGEEAEEFFDEEEGKGR